MKILLKMFLIISIATTSHLAFSDGHKTPKAPTLEFVGTLTAYLEFAPMSKDKTLITVTRGEINTVDGGKGEVIAPCADWLYVNPTGVFEQMVLCTAKMDDDSLIVAKYEGKLKLNEKGLEKMASGELINNNDATWSTAPQFQTTSEKYSWMNDYMFIGRVMELQMPNENGKEPYVKYAWFKVIN